MLVGAQEIYNHKVMIIYIYIYIYIFINTYIYRERGGKTVLDSAAMKALDI